MRHWLSSGSPFMRGLSAISDVALLNLLWVVCSLPLITIGASTSAIFACLIAREREEPCGTRAFFRAFASRFRRATALWGIVLCAGIILYADQAFAGSAAVPFQQILLALYVAISLMGLVTLPFLFVFPALDQRTIPQAIKNSFLLGVVNLPRTILILLVWCVPLVWILVSAQSFWHFAWFWIGFGFGAIFFFSVNLFKKPLGLALEKQEDRES
ncbi:MAG TPA: DUF624 domain-containing protein [Clostridia bacterium]|nr:DUF624 domain-containing protein [Clostridia bacterium]